MNKDQDGQSFYMSGFCAIRLRVLHGIRSTRDRLGFMPRFGLHILSQCHTVSPIAIVQQHVVTVDHAVLQKMYS